MAEINVIVSGDSSIGAVVAGPGSAAVVVPGASIAASTVSTEESLVPIVPPVVADVLLTEGDGFTLYLKPDGTLFVAGVRGDDGKDGVDGIDGRDGALPEGIEQSMQYRSGDILAGAEDFIYYTGEDKILIKDRLLLIDDGTFKISGTKVDTERILFSDGEAHLFRVDTSNKQITLAENVEDTEYYLGIGEPEPSERVHIAKGNLRVDGNIIAHGTGFFDDLYIKGKKVTGVASSADIDQLSGHFEEKTDFLFLKTEVISGVETQGIEYGETLGYTPKIVSNLIMPEGLEITYFTAYRDISNTGFHVNYSASIAHTGYYLETFVSPPRE